MSVSIEYVSKIDMVDFLDSLGFRPDRMNDRDAWYISPFRSEKTASFKVNLLKNIWYDFGEAMGGTIIEFGMTYFQCDSQSFIAKFDNEFSFHRRLRQHHADVALNQHSSLKIHITSARSISSPSLISYLNSRGISPEIANEYCREVVYRVNDVDYRAIGFKNDKGGYELRNPHIKLSSSPKAITFISEASMELRVFEGFFDFLSFKALQDQHNIPSSNFLVLNSVAFLKDSLVVVRRHSSVTLYLDRDAAGRRATDLMIRGEKKVRDGSGLYEGAKDLNEWLTGEYLRISDARKILHELRTGHMDGNNFQSLRYPK